MALLLTSDESQADKAFTFPSASTEIKTSRFVFQKYICTNTTDFLLSLFFLATQFSLSFLKVSGKLSGPSFNLQLVFIMER